MRCAKRRVQRSANCKTTQKLRRQREVGAGGSRAVGGSEIVHTEKCKTNARDDLMQVWDSIKPSPEWSQSEVPELKTRLPLLLIYFHIYFQKLKFLQFYSISSQHMAEMSLIHISE